VCCVLFATSTAPKDIPVQADFPSALLPFGWSTLLEQVLEQLAQQGVAIVDLVVSARPEDFRALLGNGERWGLQLRWHLAKDASTPYGIVRSFGWHAEQRVLIGHADRMVPDTVLAAAIAQDLMVGHTLETDVLQWTGWGSTTAGALREQVLHCDALALGQRLCGLAKRINPIALADLRHITCAEDLLALQQQAMAAQSMVRLPATWIQTDWGAHSPDAVIQAGAQMQGPCLVGPGCFVAAGATVGAGTVLTQDVLISSGASVRHSLVLPRTFVGQEIALEQTIVSAGRVQHLRWGVRTVLPSTDGLLLDLSPNPRNSVPWLSRATAVLLCVALAPWALVDGLVRRLRALPQRWQACAIALGHDADSGVLRLRNLRVAIPNQHGVGLFIAQYGAWLDVAQGRRCWFGARARSQSQWYALGRDWQLLLANTPVGCIHAPAWSQSQEDRQEAEAAADVFFAVTQSMPTRLRIFGLALRKLFKK
jgi:hypothetical protein